MLSDAELTQMLADAERIQALRENATPGPWKKTQVASKSGGHNALVMGDSHSLLEVFGWHDDDNAANADLTVATRTDPSAANVLRLVEEYQVMRSALLKIRHLSRNRNAKIDDAVVIAKLAIGTKAVKGVPVPEHLKDYEKGGAK